MGGTGLYLHALVDAFAVPGRWPEVVAELEQTEATSELYKSLEVLDPVGAGRVDPGNRRRVLRALEVAIGSGRPFSSYGPGVGAFPPTGGAWPASGSPGMWWRRGSRKGSRPCSKPASWMRCESWLPGRTVCRVRLARRSVTGSCFLTWRRARRWRRQWTWRFGGPVVSLAGSGCGGDGTRGCGGSGTRKPPRNTARPAGRLEKMTATA